MRMSACVIGVWLFLTNLLWAQPVVTVRTETTVVVTVAEVGHPLYVDRISESEAAGKTNAQLRAIAQQRYVDWKTEMAAAAKRRPTKAARLASLAAQKAAIIAEEAAVNSELDP